MTNPTRFLFVLLSAIATAAAAALILAITWGDARAHEAASGMRYDGACCNGDAMGLSGDCQQIPETSVREIPGGFEITLRPGDHRLVTKLHVFTIQHSKTRKSTDGRFHACLWPTEDQLQCFYAPPPGV